MDLNDTYVQGYGCIDIRMVDIVFYLLPTYVNAIRAREDSCLIKTVAALCNYT